MASEIIVAMPSGTPVVLPDGPINVKFFGAVGDGLADDTAALNAAFNAARARRAAAAGLGFDLARMVFPPGEYLVTGSLNLTGFQWPGLHIEGGGAVIYGRVPGGIILDGLGSQYLRIANLSVYSDSAQPALAGLQIGRAIDNGAGGSHHFINLTLDGTYTQSALYSVTAEVTVFDACFFGNRSAAGYATIFDGINFFNVQSAFVAVTLPQNTPQPFTGQNLISPVFFTPSGATPIWMCGTHGFDIQGGYLNTSGSTGVVLYGTSTSSFSRLRFVLHCETNPLTDVFLVSGTNTGPTISGFTFHDHDCFASNSIIKQDTGVSVVAINACDIVVGKFPNGTPKVFNGAGSSSAWTVDGQVQIPSSANWHTFVGFSGHLTEGNARSSLFGTVGFQGSQALAKPTITGSKGANAALTSLLTALANYGLITDSTS